MKWAEGEDSRHKRSLRRAPPSGSDKPCFLLFHRWEPARGLPLNARGPTGPLPTSSEAALWMGILGGQLATSAHEGGQCLAVRGEVRRLM